MPTGVRTDSSLVHASKAASFALESAAASPPSPAESAHSRRNLHSFYPYRAAPSAGTAGAAAGETVDHLQDKDTTRSCSSPGGPNTNNNNNSSGLKNNNNTGNMKCLSAIDYNMKANERYFLLNKNTFQEIFDATLYEMTGAAAPLSPPRLNATQPAETVSRDSRLSMRSSSTHGHCTRGDYAKNCTAECGGVYTTESSGKKVADVCSSSISSGRRRSDSFYCQRTTTQQDFEPAAQHKVSSSPGILRSGGAGGAQGIFTSRMTALNDITLPFNNRTSNPSSVIETDPHSQFLPPMSPLDNAGENEPLDLSVCRTTSKSSSHSSSSEASSAPGSPINLTYSSDNHPRSVTGEVRSSFTATKAYTSEERGNDKNSLSDSDEDDEEIDLVEVVSTGSASCSNIDVSTIRSPGSAEPERSSPSVVGKHSASDERARGEGRPDTGCWQPTTTAPNEPSSCHHQPRGIINTKQARSIGDEIQPTEQRCSSVDTTAEREGLITGERKSSTTTMTGGGSGALASPMVKQPRAMEKWGAFSKATLNSLVEEMVRKMDEEDNNSEASRSPPPPPKVKESDSSEKDSSKSDKNSEKVPSAATVETSSMGKSAGRQRFNTSKNNNNVSVKSVMQSYDQSLSPASQLSASQQSPKQSAPAPNLPQLVKPGSKPEESSTPTDLVVGRAASDKHSSQRGKQCWVALNKTVVLDIVETEILSEAKENNNNVTDSGHDSESRSTTPDSVSSRNSATTPGNLDEDVGIDSRNKATETSGSRCEDNNVTKSRKRKLDSTSSLSPSTATPQPSSGKYGEKTFRDLPLSFERVAMNEACAVPKRPRSSDCTGAIDTNTDILPTKQRRKSAEINTRCYNTETYFDGHRQTDIRFTVKGLIGNEGNGHVYKEAKDRASPAGRDWDPRAAGRQAFSRMSSYHGHTRMAAVPAGQSAAMGREGHRSEGSGERKVPRARGTPSPPHTGSSGNKRKSPPTTSPLSLQHSGGSPVHDLSVNNVSNITHLVQSQRTTIDYGRNEILAAKQANSIKLGLHSTTSPARQASAAIRSRCSVSVNNQYALTDTRDNNGDREMRRKRTKVDSSSKSTANKSGPPMTSARGIPDAMQAVSLFSSNATGDLTKDARSSPRLGWIAVSKADVQGLFNSVVDSMMAADAAEEVPSPQKPEEEGATSAKPRSGSTSGSPAPSGGGSGSPSGSPTSSIGINSPGSSPQRRQIDCENGSNRLENESTVPCSPPSPSDKASFVRTQSPSSSSDNLDSEHMIVDPGSPGDMFPDGEGKDSKSGKHKTFKWKSSLLMRVHEQSQTTPLAYHNKKEASTCSNRSSSNSPSSESGSEKSEKGLGYSSSTTNLSEEAVGQGRSQGHGRPSNASSRSSRRSGKKGNSHSHARAK